MVSEYEARAAEGSKLQLLLREQEISRRTDYCAQLRETQEIAKMKYTIIAFAERTHAQYPQYKNHWDKYRLGRMTKFVAFKCGGGVGGLCFG